MRLLFLGDVVGRTGRDVVADHLPRLRAEMDLDFVVLNGENAAGGFGITERICEDFLALGVDVVTTGNHVWDQREALTYIVRQPRMLRPLNYPAGTPGAGAGLFRAANGADVLVVNAMGRVFMHPELNDPFAAVDRELESAALGEAADVILVDFHAEATSEKQAMAHHLDGRVSVVVGTHTHTPTADARVLRGGTAFQSDVGMCGDYNSVLGMEPEESINRFISKIPKGRFAPATGPATLCGLAIDVDDATGLARACAPIRIGGILPEALDWPFGTLTG